MQTWQQSLAHAITNLEELLSIVELDEIDRQQFLNDSKFPLLVTREFVKRMHKGDSKDPLLLQVIPQKLEELELPGFIDDPLAEANINPVPGLLHRYNGRVLLTLTAACPVHCRFCFRRNYPYSANNPLKSNFKKILDYINSDTSIEEVIYSGGDPLLVSDQQLRSMSQQIAEIKHVERLRLHTRAPIFLPSRINQSLLSWLSKLPLQITLVIHCNHPQELDEDVLIALRRLQPVCQVLNQSVLLAAVNDNAEILAALSRKLWQARVLPYYLHVLDPVSGAAHYDVNVARGREIMQQLSAMLPGYLVPRLVKTLPKDRQKINLIV